MDERKNNRNGSDNKDFTFLLFVGIKLSGSGLDFDEDWGFEKHRHDFSTNPS